MKMHNLCRPAYTVLAGDVFSITVWLCGVASSYRAAISIGSPNTPMGVTNWATISESAQALVALRAAGVTKLPLFGPRSFIVS